MVRGPVDQATLTSYFQSPGEVYDDTKTEGALQVLASYIDGNYNYVEDGSLVTAKYVDKSITTAKIADAAVGVAQLSPGAQVNESVNNALIVALKADVVQERINVRSSPYNATGDGTADDTVAFIAAIADTPVGGTLFIPPGNYYLTDELTISKTIHIVGSMAEDLGQTYLNFNLDGQASSSVGIRINNQVHGCILENFYINHSGITTTHDGILFDGVAGDYPNFIWYSKLSGVYANNFNNNFFFKNICIASVMNCRSISANGNGFVQSGFASGLNFYSCYAQDSVAVGFKFTGSYYSGCTSSYSDGNLQGFAFQECYGGYVNDCGSESCVNFAIYVLDSSVDVDGITVVESGVNMDSIFRPTVVYVESGNCNISNVVEERLPPSNTRLYSVLYETGSTGNVESCKELLGIRIPYSGKVSIDYQCYTQGTPTGTGWLEKDIGKVVYNQNATELGTTPNKYIIFGYRRMTTGDGNVLNTDWLPLRALTGN